MAAGLASHGFGPLFYRKFWHSVKHSVLAFFMDFHSHRVSVDRFNRAHMILLPKKDIATSVDAFRPISLQNGPPKALDKLLPARLKPLMPILVHANQTGFISGRNIAENFIYAADLIPYCHLRKKKKTYYDLQARLQ